MAVFIALGSMLFMQLAVAGYTCPGMMPGHADGNAAMSADAGNQGMAGCLGLDKTQPNLCFAHAQAGNQSLDKPDLPHAQPFIAAALTLVLLDTVVTDKYRATQPPSLLLTRATSPPLSILHCCFRI